MSTRMWGTQPKYRIVRNYFKGKPTLRRTILRGLTLEQALAHCRDLNTSSSTAWRTSALARTKRYGPWFDSYTEELPTAEELDRRKREELGSLLTIGAVLKS